VAAGALAAGGAPRAFALSSARRAVRRPELAPGRFRPQPGRIYLTTAELDAVRANLHKRKSPHAVLAFEHTRALAGQGVGAAPAPTNPSADLTDWFETIYHPGLIDGNHAYNLALTYAITKDPEYGRRARDFCLAWANTYRPLPSPSRVGHMVAEPVGPTIKLFIAYDLAKGLFGAADRKAFTSWAAMFVQRGMDAADFCRDQPWVPDVTYGKDTGNPVPYGNSATWQRTMAVWAAAVVGGSTLRRTLEWNWRHTTAQGRDYGWDNLIEGLVLDGTGGQVVEDRYRSSIEYGHFSWTPLALIADVAKHAGFRIDLFRYRTRSHGYSVFTPVRYYARFLRRPTVDGSLEQSKYGGGAWPQTASRWRSVYELLYRNSAGTGYEDELARTIGFEGARTRGDNYDIYTLNYQAVLGPPL
jgi:hypothetical protein